MSKVTKSEVVAASPQRVSAVILDVEGYPNWQREMKQVCVLTKDDTGRPLTAKFDISAMGQAAAYTLAFSYPEANVIETHLTEGDMIVKQDQTYTLVESGGGTRLEYSLDMAVKWPVPDFMISAIINKGIKGNLSGIKSVAEAS
jgi:ribosome-associated toxin RatA of RatAB toxin-antitoxin module